MAPMGGSAFSKRYTGDEAGRAHQLHLGRVFRTGQETPRDGPGSLARHPDWPRRRLLAEALATHRDEELKAHAEYLLGNSEEFADLAKNDVSKLPMYQDALARFSKIPTDYQESEFAAKAQSRLPSSTRRWARLTTQLRSTTNWLTSIPTTS